MSKPKRMADCHPDRPHLAKGLCSSCYRKEYRKTHPDYIERQREADLRWHNQNKERVREYRRKWHERNPRKVKEYDLRRHHGITLEDYDTLLEKQNSCCALCGRSFNDCVTTVDHNHDTKVIRGLLCSRCNGLLGWVETYPGMLQKVDKYRETANTGLLSRPGERSDI